MNTNKYLFALVAVLLLACLAAWARPAQYQTRTVWEYRLVHSGSAGFVGDDATMNELGRDGWELVQEDSGHFYFKRPK